jgi:hypothetical protein
MKRHLAVSAMSLVRIGVAMLAGPIVGCGDSGTNNGANADRSSDASAVGEGGGRPEAGPDTADEASNRGGASRADSATDSDWSRDSGEELEAQIRETGTAAPDVLIRDPDAGAAGDGPVEDGPPDSSIDPRHGEPTSSVLAAQGNDCLGCAERSGCLDPAKQGGACEDTPGGAPSACESLLGAAGSVTETQVCLATLNTIFTSGCAATLQGVTPCFCGAADPAMCLAGTAAPSGPVVPLYACDFNFLNVASAVASFTSPSFGAGEANALVQCLVAWSCDCFGSQ